MNTFSRNVAVAALTIAIAACGKDEPAEDVAAAVDSATADALLQYVPADTPYFVGKLAPVDEDLYERLKPITEQSLKAYRGIIDGVLQAAREDSEGGEAITENEEFFEELSSVLSIEGLESLGIDLNELNAIYGHGLTPVLRAVLADSSKLDEGIARFEEKLGKSMEIGSLGNVSYRYAGDDKARIVIATFDDQLIVSLVPSSASDDMLRQVLGVERPSANLAGTGKLQQIAADNGYIPQTIGFIDVVRIAETFTSAPTGLDDELLATFGYDASELSQACRTEYMELARLMPAVELGARSMSTEEMTGHIVMKVRSDIASALKGVTAPVPGLGGPMGGALGFGVGMDVRAMRDFINARAAAVLSDPYECDSLLDLNMQAQSMQQAMQAPIPPVVFNIKGAVFLIDSLDTLMQMEAGRPPERAPDFRALLAVDGAGALYTMAASIVPGLNELNLTPNGETVELPQGMVPGVSNAVYAAMNESALAIGSGEQAESGISDMLSAKGADSQPLMAFSYDLDAYAAMMKQAMRNAVAEADSDAFDPTELSEMFDILSEYYDNMWMNVEATDRGLEMPYSVEMDL